MRLGYQTQQEPNAKIVSWQGLAQDTEAVGFKSTRAAQAAIQATSDSEQAIVVLEGSNDAVAYSELLRIEAPGVEGLPALPAWVRPRLASGEKANVHLSLLFH